ncbi:hypothetical protein Tcan_14043 [Toxocara canis]|uniref:Uncharacterized protein n=1 Tax=Toxocara canis TaxID=6265 RepID=A0A0B2VGK3_TOXCA|nr:hypothetical protein Tcan_14043 [Toxocara canis]
MVQIRASKVSAIISTLMQVVSGLQTLICTFIAQPPNDSDVQCAFRTFEEELLKAANELVVVIGDNEAGSSSKTPITWVQSCPHLLHFIHPFGLRFYLSSLSLSFSRGLCTLDNHTRRGRNKLLDDAASIGFMRRSHAKKDNEWKDNEIARPLWNVLNCVSGIYAFIYPTSPIIQRADR